MSQTVYVNRRVEFLASSAVKSNVRGNMLTERMCSVDWFDQTALDTSNDYTLTVAGSGDTGALEAGGVAGFEGVTGSGDNEVSFLATGLIFDITQSPVIETKIKIEDVTGTIVYFGFSDAVTESTPAATIDADSNTEIAEATDAVGFVIDADFGASSIFAMSVNTGGTIQTVDTGLDWSDNESYVLRIALDTDGNARFYVNGIEKAYIASATADVPLCAILNYGTRAGDGPNTVHMRYLAKFQDIP